MSPRTPSFLKPSPGAPSFTTGQCLSRRSLIRAGGISLALPWISAMVPAFAAEPKAPRRFIGILNSLGFHAPFFFPQQPGRDYTPSRYLETLAFCKEHFTVLSGLNHLEVRDSHASDQSFFTGAVHPGSPSFRNSISLDQLAAERIGRDTRYPSLNFSTSAGSSCSYSSSGVALPPETSPARSFAKLFVNGTPEEVRAELARVRQGQSILDGVRGEARALSKNLGPEDRDKLEEYLTSIRDLEGRLQRSEAFVRNPKPDPGVPPIKDPGIGETTALLGQMLEVARLALQTDLTRLVTIYFITTTKTPSKPGNTYAHHDLSHHGQDAGKIERLAEVEADILLTWGKSLKRLEESGLLRDTVSVIGSALGNASSHDATNLPILVGGGAFRHGAHLAFDPKSPPPLCNLWVQVLQHLGIQTERFGTSTADHLPGLSA